MSFSHNLDVLAVRVTFAPGSAAAPRVLTVTGTHRLRTHHAVLDYNRAAFGFLAPLSPQATDDLRLRILAHGGQLHYGYQRFPYAAEAGDAFHEMPEQR